MASRASTRVLKLPNTFPYGRQKVSRTKTTTAGTNAVRGRIRRPPAS